MARRSYSVPVPNGLTADSTTAIEAMRTRPLRHIDRARASTVHGPRSAREKPDSLTELAELAGRSKSNLSRTLKTMSRYGLVELTEGERGTLVPRVPYDQVRLDVSLTAGARRVI